MKRSKVKLEVSEYGRPVIFVAEYYDFGGIVNQCVFSSREEAIRWAKFEMRDCIDWDTWTSPVGQYPCESQRDNVDLTPTFIATHDSGGHHREVTVTRTEVNGEFNWWAKEADGSWRR